MPLEVVENLKGWHWVRGAGADPGGSEVLPLAPAEGGGGSRLGQHIVGINRRFGDLLFIRAFFDPATIMESWRYDYLGYMQILEAKIHGRSVPPQVFGGALGQYRVVAGNSVIDFMGVGYAVAIGGGALPPLYPFNAALLGVDRLGANGSIYDFARTSAKLGFIYVPLRKRSGAPTGLASTAASIAPVNLSLLEERQLDRFPDAVLGTLTLDLTDAELANKTLFQHAIDCINSSNRPAEDKAITRASVRLARFVGNSLLITLINDEEMDPVLRVTLTKTPGTTKSNRVKVALLNYDAMQSLDEDACYDMMWRAARHFRKRGSRAAMLSPQGGRGRTKPMPLSVQHGDEVAHVTVRHVICGFQPHPEAPWVAIDGIEHDVPLVYNGYTRTLKVSDAGPPSLRPFGDLEQFNALLLSYRNALQTPTEQPVDTRNFELVGAPWAEGLPPPFST